MRQLWEEAGPFPDLLFLVLEVRGGFLGGASGEEPAYQCRRHETWIRSLGKRAWQPTLAFLPGESHGQRSLVGYSPQGCKKSDTTEVT